MRTKPCPNAASYNSVPLIPFLTAAHPNQYQLTGRDSISPANSQVAVTLFKKPQSPKNSPIAA